MIRCRRPRHTSRGWTSYGRRAFLARRLRRGRRGRRHCDEDAEVGALRRGSARTWTSSSLLAARAPCVVTCSDCLATSTYSRSIRSPARLPGPAVETGSTSKCPCLPSPAAGLCACVNGATNSFVSQRAQKRFGFQEGKGCAIGIAEYWRLWGRQSETGHVMLFTGVSLCSSFGCPAGKSGCIARADRAGWAHVHIRLQVQARCLERASAAFSRV